MIVQQASRRTTTSVPSTQNRRTAMTKIEILVVVAIIVILIALLIPPVKHGGGGGARRAECKNNLKQIGLALHHYHETYNVFPPAYTVDGHGKPLHSWRTLILPYINEQVLYQKIDLSKPWNDSANAEAFNSIPNGYHCPSTTHPKGMTTYLAITEENSCFPPGQSRSLSEVTDGTSNTLMVVDVAQSHAVHWMSPQDADETLILGIGAEVKDLQHKGGIHGLLADGSIRYLSATLPVATWRALISVAANDPVGEF